ncbi:MAG: hypothetical protein HUJ29_01850 [Gammaproteobacteria bacterium]|nr:hypothetical protein [Gammaproteobacteria bacterium]
MVRIQSLRAFLSIPILVLLSSNALANDGNGTKNQAFSYFGLGVMASYYKETSTGNSLLNVQSSSIPSSFVQYSGSYTPIDESYGFYITTMSPLFTISSTEIWNNTKSWNNVDYGTLQTNQTELGLSHINITGGKLLSPGHQLLAGIRYSQHNFTRYNFHAGSGSSSLNTDLVDFYNSLTPEEQAIYAAFGDGIAFEIPGCTNQITPPSEGMECLSVAILEQVSSFSFTLGYRYDSFFIDGFDGNRFIFQSSIATPLVYIINNTFHPGNTLIGAFGGFDITINTATSIFHRRDMQLMLGLETSYIHRSQVRQAGNPLTYPYSDTIALSLYMNFSWAFD